MTYLVTGGTGLLGSRIVRDLVKGGDPVIVYDLFMDKSMLEMLLDEDERTLVKLVPGDVVDFDYLMHTVKESNVDIIIHTAAILGEAIEANPRLAAMAGTEGTINIFEIARLLRLKKVVWSSSNAVFASNAFFARKYNKEYIPNDAPHHPWGLYGACKSFGENAADYYSQEFGTDITTLRYGAFIFGAGQKRGNPATIVKELILNPALDKAGRVPWGDDAIGWLYVDDAARAAVLACKHCRVKTGAFNIVGHIHSVRELADYVRELIPDANIELLPGYLEGPSWKLETTATEEELGYYPQWSIRQGIKETINMVRRQHSLSEV